MRETPLMHAGRGALRAAPVLLLFSGGVDSALLAALVHRALPSEARHQRCCPLTAALLLEAVLVTAIGHIESLPAIDNDVVNERTCLFSIRCEHLHEFRRCTLGVFVIRVHHTSTHCRQGVKCRCRVLRIHGGCVTGLRRRGAVLVQVPIDLANVCFDGGASPDRLAALDALAELQTHAPDRCLLPKGSQHLQSRSGRLGDLRVL